jgi:serine/threonine-protein kinase
LTELSDGIVRLIALGAIELKGINGADADAILRQPKRLALLAYLALASPRGFQRRDILLALLWPELDQAGARHALRNALYHLRRGLGDAVIESRGTEEIGIAAGALWCDAVAFEQTLDAGEPGRALDLYKGDLLHGFFLSGSSPAFEEWLERERSRLRLRAADAAWEVASVAEKEGKAPRAVEAARTALALRPDDEPWLRKVLALLHRLGDQAGALRAYEEFAARLSREFEVEPAPETRALMRQVRERRPTAPEFVMPRRSSGSERRETPSTALEQSSSTRNRPIRIIVGLLMVAAAAVLASMLWR